MRIFIVVTAVAVVLPAASCGPKPTLRDVPPRPEPPTTLAPALGDPPPPPSCLDEPVPVVDSETRGGRLLVSGQRLYSIGRDPTSIEVGWIWGGRSAVLARGPQDRPIVDVAIDERHVYWSISAHRDALTGCVVADDGAIYRVPHAGGAVETVVAAAGSPRDLAIADGHLFWLDEGPCTPDPKIPTPRSIRRQDLATGTTVTVRDDPGLAELAVEDDTLTMLVDGEVARSDAAGAGYRVLATAPGGANLVVARGRIFVALHPDGISRHVAEIPADGGAPVRVAQLGGVDTLWADADTLYVSGAEIWARPLAGGPLAVVAEDAELAAIAGDRLLAWVGPQRQTLVSLPRTRRLHAIVATDLIGATSLVSDATAVYWADRYGGIWSQPRAGGAAVQLATDTGAEHQLALADDRIVFTSDGMDQRGPGTVGWIPKTGGAVTMLATELTAPLQLAVAGTDVYVGDGGGAIARYSVTGGGAPARLAPRDRGRIVAMVADSKRVYFMRADDPAIFALDRAGGAIATLGQTSDQATDLLLDDGDLVVATRFDGIFRVAAAGGTPRIVARPQEVPVQIARDRTHLYWASPTEIARIPRRGGAKEQVGPGADGALAVTDDAIYWSSSGSVRRLPTPGPGPTRGATVQATEPETGPLAVAGTTAFVGTRTDVRSVDLTTGAIEVIAATHRTPSWVGADATAVYFLMDDRFWTIDRAAAAKHRAAVMAATRRTTERERAFDTNFVEPLAPTPVTGVRDVELTADALVWTTGDKVMRLRVRGGAIDVVASGLEGATWLAHDATQIYVTAKTAAGWAVLALGAPGAAPIAVATLDAPPRGLAVDAGDVVVSTETAVLRLAAGTDTLQVIAAHQRGAAAVAVAGRTVYWMTRDGIMVSDGTGCGAHHAAAWPSMTGPLPGAGLAVSADGVVFTDPASGTVVTAH